MFRFLSNSLRSAIIFANNIILSFLSFESFKLLNDFKFSRISIEIFHDDIFLIKIKNETIKQRKKKFVYLNFNLNYKIQQLFLYDEYEKIITKDYVIFNENFVQIRQRKIIHFKMLHNHEKFRKNHYEEKLKMIQK